MVLRAPRSVGVAGALLLLTGLGACGGGSSTAPAPPGVPTSTQTATQTATQTSSPTSGAYLEVPDGVTLTAPGTASGFGDSAVVAWTPRQGQVGVVDLAVRRVERSTVGAALRGFDLTAQQRASTPYFVHLAATNLGTSLLGGVTLPVYLQGASGNRIEATGVPTDFAACPGPTTPTAFVTRARARLCLAFLAPAASRRVTVEFDPPVGVSPLTWSGPAASLARPGAGRDR